MLTQEKRYKITRSYQKRDMIQIYFTRFNKFNVYEKV